MKINGIIAEYNPFHNGHKYLLDTSKAISGADYTIAIMSGNFVQRGGPALTDKHTRAEMALRGGADLILELPPYYATASAEAFAYGAVSILNSLGTVDTLSFGSECGDLGLLTSIASLLVTEPEEYRLLLRSKLNLGMNFPSARATALSEYLGSDKSFQILSSPNNILGIEYLKALNRQESNIRPLTITRSDNGYHSEDIKGEFCSASAIRKALLSSVPLSELSYALPESSACLLSSSQNRIAFVSENDFSEVLYYRLLSERDRGYEKYPDVSEELSDRIKNKLSAFRDYSSFCDILKTKEVTYSRISRCLLHIMLDLVDAPSKDIPPAIPYVRVLGFRKEAENLLSAICNHSSIPVITKLTDAKNSLSDKDYLRFQNDLRISQFYLGIAAQKRKSVPINEYTHPMIII